MKMKKTIVAAGVGFLALVGLAAAQVTPVPLIQSSHPFADLIQVIPNGAPTAQSQYEPWAGVTNVYGYYKAVVVNGFNYTFGTNVTYAAFNPATVVGGYIYLAAAPFDGARNCMFSTQTATVTVYANTGQTINNAVTSLTANTGVCYLYSQSNTTWDRD